MSKVSDEDRDAARFLAALGVDAPTIARLIAWAQADGMTLQEMAAYVLSDYAPPQHGA